MHPTSILHCSQMCKFFNSQTFLKTSFVLVSLRCVLWVLIKLLMFIKFHFALCYFYKLFIVSGGALKWDTRVRIAKTLWIVFSFKRFFLIGFNSSTTLLFSNYNNAIKVLVHFLLNTFCLFICFVIIIIMNLARFLKLIGIVDVMNVLGYSSYWIKNS